MCKHSGAAVPLPMHIDLPLIDEDRRRNVLLLQRIDQTRRDSLKALEVLHLAYNGTVIDGDRDASGWLLGIGPKAGTNDAAIICRREIKGLGHPLIQSGSNRTCLMDFISFGPTLIEVTVRRVYRSVSRLDN